MYDENATKSRTDEHSFICIVIPQRYAIHAIFLAFSKETFNYHGRWKVSALCTVTVRTDALALQ